MGDTDTHTVAVDFFYIIWIIVKFFRFFVLFESCNPQLIVRMCVCVCMRARSLSVVSLARSCVRFASLSLSFSFSLSLTLSLSLSLSIPPSLRSVVFQNAMARNCCGLAHTAGNFFQKYSPHLFIHWSILVHWLMRICVWQVRAIKAAAAKWAWRGQREGLWAVWNYGKNQREKENPFN